MKKKYAPIFSIDNTAAQDEPDEKKCTFKPECSNCTYPGTGFICRNTSDGTCLKDWRKGIFHRSESHAGG